MEEDKKHIETRMLFQAALADLEVPPSPEVWAKVEAGLDRGKKKPAGWWWLGIGLLLLLSGSVLYYFQPALFSQSKPSASTSVPSSHSKINPKTGLQSNTLPADSALHIASAQTARAGTGDSPTMSKEKEKAENTGTAYVSSGTETHAVSDSDHVTSITPRKVKSSDPASLVSSASPDKQQVTSRHTSDSSMRQSIQPVNTQPKPSGSFKPQPLDPSSGSAVGESKSIPPDAAKQKTAAIASKENASKAPKKDSTMSTPALVSPIPAKTIADVKPALNNKSVAGMDSVQKKAVDAEVKSVATGSTETKTSSPSASKSKDSLTVVKPLLLSDSVATKKTADSLLTAAPKLGVKNDSAKATTGPLSGFSISGYFSPEFGKNMIQSNKSSFNIGKEIQNPRAAGGVRFGVSFRDKVEVSIACAYSQVNQESQHHAFYFPKTLSKPYVFNSSFGDMAVPAAAMLATFNQLAPVPMFKAQYQYSETLGLLNIPISATLHLNKGRLRTYVSAGINIQYALNQHGTLEVIKENETVREEYNSLDVRKLNYAAGIGLGMGYKISKHIGVFLEPNARLNLLNTTNSSSTVKSTAYFIGGAAGIKISL
jgi:hypothetical protein